MFGFSPLAGRPSGLGPRSRAGSVGTSGTAGISGLTWFSRIAGLSRLARALGLAALLVILAGGCGILPKVTIIDDPLDKEEHYALGLTYENDGEMELAEREYRLALPLPAASAAMGNLSYQVRGDAKEAAGYWRSALARESIPSAANNLAWIIVVEGGSLTEAKRWATLAVSEGEKRGEPEKILESYRATLAQIEAAIEAAAP